MQPKDRPLRPHWLKSYVRDLGLEPYRALSATERGVLADLVRLAAEKRNRIPWTTSRLVSESLGIRPHIVGKAVTSLLSLGFVSVFAESETDTKNKDLAFLLGGVESLGGGSSLSPSCSTTLSPEKRDELKSINGPKDDDIPF